MEAINVLRAGQDYQYRWPTGDIEHYASWIDYRAVDENGEHTVSVGFGSRPVYARERPRVLVWIDGRPEVELIGADDFATSGELLSEIRVRGEARAEMCGYPDDAVPEQYACFDTVGLPTRIDARNIRQAWAVVANISDHKTLIALAALRRTERRG